jgi:hypothetical protein
LPTSRVISRFACAATVAAVTAGCSAATDAFKSDAGWFSKPIEVFRSDGSQASVTNKNFELGPRGPVAAEDLVGADGRCSLPVSAEASQAAAPAADRPVGSMAGDLAGTPMAPAPADADPSVPLVAGGIALGMNECDVVRRAGMPSNVNIGVGDGNDRRVVLTYLDGTWPGIYTFASGRLKEISAAPAQPKSAKPAPKRKTTTAAKPKAPQSPPVRVR